MWLNKINSFHNKTACIFMFLMNSFYRLTVKTAKKVIYQLLRGQHSESFFFGNYSLKDRFQDMFPFVTLNFLFCIKEESRSPRLF